MARFQYSARDKQGRATSGYVEAADSGEVRRLLRANDLYMTRQREVAEAVQRKRLGSSSFLASRPRMHDVIVLLRQIGTLLRAGIPVDQALESVRQQSPKPALQRMLQDVLDGVVKGQSLAACMRRHPEIFEPVTIALVQTGETTGNIDSALTLAADHLQRQDDLNAKLAVATLYPKLVVAAAFAAVITMLVMVVPTFQTVYAAAHAQLPAPTRILIALSNFILHWWPAIILVCAGAYFGTRFAVSTASGRKLADTWKLRVPIVGTVLRKVSIAGFTNALASGIRAGVPVLQALTVAADTAGNTVIRDAVIGASVRVREGALIAAELDKSGEFPPMVTSMIAAGEKTGELDKMLDEVNTFYEKDVSFAIEKLVRLVEPVVTVVVGTLVLLILLALYTPIFNLGRALRGY